MTGDAIVRRRRGWRRRTAYGSCRGRHGNSHQAGYRDLDDPGAALFHISAQDMDTAMGWFRSDTFKEATKLAKVTGRSFYLAQPQT